MPDWTFCINKISGCNTILTYGGEIQRVRIKKEASSIIQTHQHRIKYSTVSTVQFLYCHMQHSLSPDVFADIETGVPNNANYQDPLVRIQTIRPQCTGRNSPLSVLFINHSKQYYYLDNGSSDFWIICISKYMIHLQETAKKQWGIATIFSCWVKEYRSNHIHTFVSTTALSQRFYHLLEF